MINMSCIEEQIEMNKRKELLNKHPNKIYQGNDGKWRTYLPDKEKRRKLIKRNSKEEIENAVIDYWREESYNPTLSDIFKEWNDRRLQLKKISESTHLRYEKEFARFYKDFGKKKIKTISPEEVEDFLESQIPKHDLTSKRFNNLKTITKGFFKRAKKLKLIDFSVETMIEELDVSETDFKKVIKEDYEEVYDEEEMSNVINYLKNNLDVFNIAILLIFVSGLRVGEVVALKHSDFNGCAIKVRRTETHFEKNGKSIYEVKDFPKTEAGVRTVVIPKEYIWLMKKIQLLNPFEDYVFVRNGSRVHTHSIRDRLRRVCDKLEIYRKSPHKIRKTYGTILLDNKIDNQLIIGQMGHADILITERHYHRNRKNIEEKQEIISSIPDFTMDRIAK